MKHWNLQFVLNNLSECNATYNKMKELPSFITDQSYFKSDEKITSVQ